MDKQAWQAISRQLSAPFPPDQVSWRVQGKANAQGRAQVLAYVDARDVATRLDDVVGCENWEFTWEPVAAIDGALQVAKGRLVLFGVAKEDVGDASAYEPNKGAVSDALKRAAVLWGVGRYLYSLPAIWVTLQDGKIPAEMLGKLRAGLARVSAKAS